MEIVPRSLDSRSGSALFARLSAFSAYPAVARAVVATRINRCFSFFIGLSGYQRTGRSALTILPLILWWIGLNLIQSTLPAAQAESPVFLTHPVEGLDSSTINAVHLDDGFTIFAGRLLGLRENEEIRILEEKGPYFGLTYDDSTGRLFVSSAAGIDVWNLDQGQKIESIPTDTLVWEIFLQDGFLWFLQSDEVLLFEPDTLALSRRYPVDASPRPVLLSFNELGQSAWLATGRGIYELKQSGLSLLLTSQQLGSERITWAVEEAESILIGSWKDVFRYRKKDGSLEKVTPAGYREAFEAGINNAVTTENYLAVTAYPSGAVLYDRRNLEEVGRIRSDIQPRLGDIHRVATDGHLLFLFGDSGVHQVETRNALKFWPAGDAVWSAKESWVFQDQAGAQFFTQESWWEWRPSGMKRRDIPDEPNWVARTPDDRWSLGWVYQYYLFEDNTWHQEILGTPIVDLHWMRESALAVGAEGLFQFDRNWTEKKVPHEAGHLRILATGSDKALLANDENRIFLFKETESSRSLQALEGLSGDRSWREAKWIPKSDTFVLISKNRLFQLDEELKPLENIQPPWHIEAFDRDGSFSYLLIRHEDGPERVLSISRSNERELALVPESGRVGAAFDLIRKEEVFLLFGEDGILEIPSNQLQYLPPAPSVYLTIGLDKEPVRKGVYPRNTNNLSIIPERARTSIPLTFEYSVNGGPWNRIRGEQAAVPIAGSGVFNLRYRSVYPNGVTSVIEETSFRVLAPWYQRPSYLGLITALLLGAGIGVYFWRYQVLRRTNLRLAGMVKEKTEELARATSTRTHFLAGLSHDIRNPLNGVLLIADSLYRKPPSTEEDARLTSLKDLGLMVDQMLGEILDFSAIDLSRVALSPSPNGIEELLEQDMASEADRRVIHNRLANCYDLADERALARHPSAKRPSRSTGTGCSRSSTI